MDPNPPEFDHACGALNCPFVTAYLDAAQAFLAAHVYLDEGGALPTPRPTTATTENP
jgi:hypothetical protein